MNALIKPMVFLNVPIVYLGLVHLGVKFMKTRKAVGAKWLKVLYNAFQVLFSLYVLKGLLPLVSLSDPFGINVVNKALEPYVFLHYISKFVDFIDTFFIVIGKKDQQLSFLHLSHHATILPLFGFILYIGAGGTTAAFGALINSFVHAVMYFHYLITTLGLKNPLKKYITNLQLLQFMMCELHVVAALLFCKSQLICDIANIQLIYHIFMLYEFSKFKNITYQKKAE